MYSAMPMQQDLRRWISARKEWWGAFAIIAAYAALLYGGDGRGRFYTLCALPVAGSLLVAAIARRRVSTFALLSAAAIVPPALIVAIMVADSRPPHSHDCNIGAFMAVAWLGFAGAQVVVMAMLAVLLRGTALYVLQRRARSQRRNTAYLEVDR